MPADDGARTARTITSNTAWNVVGMAVPVPAALIAIPMLIRTLGSERFGFLTIAWTLLGYFSLFDLGFARATTKYLAEAVGLAQRERIRQLFWTSLNTHIVLGVLGGAILLLATPWIAGTLEVSAEFRPEVSASLYILAASVPIIVVTSLARGVLEGLQRFDLVNVVKVPASLITYLGPLVALLFTRELPALILLISVGRLAVLLVYLAMCFRLLPEISRPAAPEGSILRPLASLGGWITTTTLMTPGLASIDRFVIGSVVSVAAVTAYAAPYEVVTKLWIFSSSLLGVLFAAFSSISSERATVERLYWRSIIVLFALTTAASSAVVAFAPEFFALWLGASVPPETATVARWLTIGVLVNVIAQVPFTTLQATGHADATGKLQVVQVPFYVLAVWFAAARWGVVGVAIVWAVRAVVDALLMFSAAERRLELRASRSLAGSGAWALAGGLVLVAWCWPGVAILAPNQLIKIPLVGISILIFVWASWRQLDHGFGSLR